MSNTATVTAQLGPDKTATALVFNNLTRIVFDVERQVLSVIVGEKVTDFDLYDVATVTYTISSHTATIAVS